MIYYKKPKDIYEELYDDNDKFDFSSYPKSHSNFTRNLVGYIDDDNKPIIQNAKVPARFKEDFELKVPFERNVCKPKGGAVNFYDKSENENNIEKKEVREYHNKLLNMNYNIMILEYV